MNNERRKTLDGVIVELQLAKAKVDAFDASDITDLLESARVVFEEVKEDEQGAFDALPEGLQQGENGQRMEEIIGFLEEASGDAADLINEINNRDWSDTIDNLITKAEDSK